MGRLSLAALSACILWLLPAPASAEGSVPPGVHSIVNNAETEVVCKSATQFTEKRSLTITVLDSEGAKAAAFACWCDQFRSLQRFSGEILDTTGKSVRKIRKSDLERSEYSAALATDDYLYYYECRYPTFPFTVSYNWEVKNENGFIGFPSFVPQTRFGQLVQQASYRIETPQGQPCRYHALHNDGQIEIEESVTPDSRQVVKASAARLLPIAEEPLSPRFLDLAPQVFFAPSAFQFDKTEGDMSTWKGYGAWLYSLLEGSDALPEPFKQTLHQLTDSIGTDEGKVQALYDYIAANTRYVSIQLGIGGWKPIAADEVRRNGFGDCKGLCNYLRAMLKEIGIPSTYTVISTENERLIPGFSSANQMNHVVLQVPLRHDTLWLECTNAHLPFGYIHQDIAGHDGLLVEPDGGRICRLPSYPDSLNTQHIAAHVQLQADNGARMQVCETSRMCQYEDRARLCAAPPGEQKDVVRASIGLPQADILNLQVEEQKSSRPSVACRYEVSCKRYGNSTKNRLLIPVNVFRSGFSALKGSKRTVPIHIGHGYMDTDSIRITIPEGYSIEGLPDAVERNSPFGSFRSSVTAGNGEVVVHQQLTIYRGTYPPEEYAAFNNFLQEISEQYNGYAVLRKNR